MVILINVYFESFVSFEYYRVEFMKYYIEVKDNVWFFFIFERYFKNLVYGVSFNIVFEIIFLMMNVLRMVWIISRYYNRDERMVSLMERIVWEFSERVVKIVNVRIIFKWVWLLYVIIRKYIIIIG